MIVTPGFLKLAALLRFGGALLYLVLAVSVGVIAVYRAQSQYLVDVSRGADSDSLASQAIALDPRNPDAYKMKGIWYLNKEKYADALSSLEKSAELKPTDYLLWLRIGYARYKLREFAPAIIAYNKSIALAPGYAKPKRYLGRLYLKVNDTEKGFNYLSQAADIDPKYMYETLQLARGAFPKDANAIEKAVKPNSVENKRTAALYFIKHRLQTAKLNEFMTGNSVSDIHRIEFVSKLIAKKEYERAFEIWRSGTKTRNPENNLFVNGDFESQIDESERNFGWVVNEKLPNTVLQIEKTNVHSNKIALSVIYKGKSNPDIEALSQIIPTNPGSTYHLNFAARSKDLVSGGLPVISVFDAETNALLARSRPISNSNWSTYSLQIKPPADSGAMIVKLQRSGCKTKPCPAFGQIWLDAFELIRN